MNTLGRAAEPKRRILGQAETSAAGAERLSILLVNYNGARYLAPCLESIRRFAPPGTQVVLEDNASTDGSIEAVEESFPGLQIVRSSRNLGFAGGNNLAGKMAKGKFILLLNTDTLLLEALAPVVDWLEDHPSYGALTIKMLDGNRIARACTGRFPSALRLTLFRFMLVSPQQYADAESYDVDWVQGSFLLMRADLWRTLNGLDERYFMYAEDVDLCRRIWDAGLKCVYLPHYQYLHWGGFNPSRFPELVCSHATYVKRHMRGPQLMLCRAVLVGGCFMRAVFYEAKCILLDRLINHTKAEVSWRAFKTLIWPQA
jgi:GT2 family glycosyltransferase